MGPPWQICNHLNYLKKLHSMWFVCMGLGIRDDMAFWDIVVGPFELIVSMSACECRKLYGTKLEYQQYQQFNPCSDDSPVI